MKIVEQSAKLVSMTPSPIHLIELFGRTCYQSTSKMKCDNPNCGVFKGFKAVSYCTGCQNRGEKFVKNLIKRGHESVLEHASASFILTTDRGITHQIVRHRVGVAYSQESTRYCDYSDGITVVKPSLSEAKSETDALKDWTEGIKESEKAYKCLTNNLSVSPQTARSVLPTCLKTELAMTANFRAWRHIFKNRILDSGAQNQHKELMKLVLKELLNSEARVVFEDIGNQCI